VPAAREAHSRYVFARVLYTHYCAFELSTRIFAVIQRLARTIHIGIPGLHGSRSIGARGPHRQRVAIKRHEFHLQSNVALATPVCEAHRGSVSASVSPSLLAPMRGTTARSAVAVSHGNTTRSSVLACSVAHRRRSAPRRSLARPRRIVASVPAATSSHDTSCVFLTRMGAVTRFDCSATCAAAPGQTPRYPCLLEAA
jgi:hypothetical protein